MGSHITTRPCSGSGSSLNLSRMLPSKTPPSTSSSRRWPPLSASSMITNRKWPPSRRKQRKVWKWNLIPCLMMAFKSCHYDILPLAGTLPNRMLLTYSSLLNLILHSNPIRVIGPRAVWSALAKFHHFGNTFTVLGTNGLRVYLVKIRIKVSNGSIFIVAKSQMLSK